MEIINIIRSGRVVELSAAVFGQTLSGSTDTYAYAFSPEEEIELVRRLLSDENPNEWLMWMAEYRKHYILSKPAVNMLIENLQSEIAEKALVAEFTRYSYTEEQAMKICRKALAAGAGTYRQLIETVCTCCRIYYSDLPLVLRRLDERDKDEDRAPHYADIYERAIRKYRADNNIDRFYEAEKARA